MTPTVSVIIPSYNHSRFIKQSIQSVIDQDYGPIELIIIDDGSQDNSVEKIKSLIDVCNQRFNRFEFRYRKNQGLPSTLNEALEWVSGEFLCSLASDDIWLPKKISTQVKYMMEHPDVPAIFGEISLINENSEITKKVSRPYRKYHFKDIILNRYHLPAPTAMMRTSIVKNLGGFTEGIAIEDWTMWLEMTKGGRSLVYLPIEVALYRRHEDNLSSKLNIMHSARLQIIDLYKDSPYYKKAKSLAYLNTLNDSEQFHLDYFLKAIKNYPPIIFSMKFLRQSLKKYLNSKK